MPKATSDHHHHPHHHPHASEPPPTSVVVLDAPKRPRGPLPGPTQVQPLPDDLAGRVLVRFGDRGRVGRSMLVEHEL